jgi:hypothetical protein
VERWSRHWEGSGFNPRCPVCRKRGEVCDVVRNAADQTNGSRRGSEQAFWRRGDRETQVLLRAVPVSHESGVLAGPAVALACAQEVHLGSEVVCFSSG